MSITYATALERVQELFRTDGKKASTVRTYLSDVKRFVRAVGLELSDPIDPEFVRDHEAYVAAALAEHPPEFRVTASFRRSLRAFREKLEALRWHDDLPGTLAEVLLAFLEREGLTQAEFAKRAGLPLGSIEDYVGGRSTPRGDRARIRKLERAMGLPEGRLEDCVPVQSCRNPHDLPAQLFPEGYQGANNFAREARTRIRKRIRKDRPDYADLNPDELRRLIEDVAARDDARQAKGGASKALPRPPELRRYHLLERDWPPHLLEAWGNLVAYKTDPAHEGELWSKASIKQRRELLEAFFGWCLLRKAPEGDAWRNLRWPGVDPESLSGVRAQRQQHEALAKLGLSAPLAREDATLALLAVPELVKGYVDFRVRAAGAYNSTVISFLALCQMLLKKQTGFLWEKDQLSEELPAGLAPQPTKKNKKKAKRKGKSVRTVAWRSHCKAAHRELGKRLKVARRRQDKSASAIRKLGPIPEMEDQFGLLDQMHELVRQDLKVSRGRDHDVLFTRYLTSLLLTETVLRRSHFAKLNLGTNGDGRVRIRGDSFVLHIPVMDYKNSHSRQFEAEGLDGETVFDDLSPELQDALRKYLDEVRPRCLRGQTHDALLVVPTAGRPVTDKWVYKAIVKLTREYLGEDGVGLRIQGVSHLCPHLYRTWVATAVKRHGTNEDVANVLQDSRTMVPVYAMVPSSVKWRDSMRRIKESRARMLDKKGRT